MFNWGCKVLCCSYFVAYSVTPILYSKYPSHQSQSHIASSLNITLFIGDEAAKVLGEHTGSFMVIGFNGMGIFKTQCGIHSEIELVMLVYLGHLLVIASTLYKMLRILSRLPSLVVTDYTIQIYLFSHFNQDTVSDKRYIIKLNSYITRSTQRAQTSLVEADHYSHIAHCKNVEPWLWKTTLLIYSSYNTQITTTI